MSRYRVDLGPNIVANKRIDRMLDELQRCLGVDQAANPRVPGAWCGGGRTLQKNGGVKPRKWRKMVFLGNFVEVWSYEDMELRRSMWILRVALYDKGKWRYQWNLEPQNLGQQYIWNLDGPQVLKTAWCDTQISKIQDFILDIPNLVI